MNLLTPLEQKALIDTLRERIAALEETNRMLHLMIREIRELAQTAKEQHEG